MFLIFFSSGTLSVDPELSDWVESKIKKGLHNESEPDPVIYNKLGFKRACVFEKIGYIQTEELYSFNKSGVVRLISNGNNLSLACSDSYAYFIERFNYTYVLKQLFPYKKTVYEKIDCMEILQVNNNEIYCSNLAPDAVGGLYQIFKISISDLSMELVIDTKAYGTSEGTFRVSNNGEYLAGLFWNDEQSIEEIKIINLANEKEVRVVATPACYNNFYFKSNSNVLFHYCIEGTYSQDIEL